MGATRPHYRRNRRYAGAETAITVLKGALETGRYEPVPRYNQPVFQEVIELARQAEYDFRVTACPDDPLQYLFDEWVSYYRGKWAIARYLQPRRILEIGVRYGYSALAFLDACPSAEYSGIDLDTDLCGGTRGAIAWARDHSRQYRADFLVTDSQKLDRFPGGDYDLIHVDGQKDEQGIVHDLGVAIGQARYILVDAYFRTRDHFLAASEFLFRNRDLIAYYGVIPGYAGDLLIVAKEGAGSSTCQADSSAVIRDAYTSSYYLLDCGGFDSFKRTGGVKLDDPRLRTVAQLATLAPRGRALDLGCGRGELSIQLARMRFDVTAIDYSPDAIALAKSAAARSGIGAKIRYLCDDLVNAPLDGEYDAVVAADVIEHLSPAELDRLYERIAAHLSPQGLFVIHTYPNSWYYRYEHARKRRVARSVGAYLPLNPRSRYEQLMHINEQSPRVLRRQLRQYFPHVLLWFCDHGVARPFENLTRHFSIREMAQAGDLFACASARPLEAAVIAREFRMDPALSIHAGDLRIEVLRVPVASAAGSTFHVDVRVENRSRASLKSYPPNPVHLSYHWLERVTAKVTIFDGERSVLDPALDAQSTQSYCMSVRAPVAKMSYRLRITLVQEFVRWLDRPPVEAFAEAIIDIT